MESLETIIERVRAAVPDAVLAVVPNESPSRQPSLRVDPDHAEAVARFVRDAEGMRFDYASNVTGVDWLERKVKEKIKSMQVVDGVEKEVEQTVDRVEPGYLEAVYHLYSMELRHGPLILRQRTADRSAGASVASLTPVWRSCEFQEREVYDLFGVGFRGHPDLRRILMWEEYLDHPMRKDFVDPDDYEYEPTPHDAVLERARGHYR